MALLRVMVVDDEEDVRHIVRYTLINYFEVTTAHDGLDALDKLDRYEPDFIIMDVMMPLMNGLEASQEIRENPRFNDIPILFLSGLSTQKDMERGYRSGADLYLTKPFEPSHLLNVVKNLVKKRATPSRKKFTIEQIQMMEQEALATKKETHEIPPPPLPEKEEDSFRKIAAQQPQPMHRPSPYETDAMKALPRIMIVDDDREALDVLQLILQNHFEVVMAMDGIEAIRKVILYQPDLFLLDIMLPKMSGYQLCQSLRRNDTYKNAPIITISAKSSPKDRDYALRMGADKFVTKPFEAHQLLKVVRDAIAMRKMSIRSKKLSIQDIKDSEQEEKGVFQKEKEKSNKSPVDERENPE
jgi:DNA-binding response OmpR family regulator